MRSVSTIHAAGFFGSPSSEAYSFGPTTPYIPTLYTSYDVGNIWQKGSAVYQYNLSQEHAPSSYTIGGNTTTYNYTANGSRSLDGSFNVFTYDAENRLVSLAASGNSPQLQNTFDGDGKRVQRIQFGTSTTNYIGDWCEHDPVSGTVTVYYPFNGQPIAR